MDEKKKEEVKASEIGNLVVEALSDADLESVSGGGNNVVVSTAVNSCCPQSN